MWLDVEVDHGANYRATRYWKDDLLPLEGVRKVNVQLDLDYPHFVEACLALMKR